MTASAAAILHTFTAYKDKLMNVEQFQYLDPIISMDDNDVPAMRSNLKRAQKTMVGGGRLRRMLKKEEVLAKVAGIFY